MLRSTHQDELSAIVQSYLPDTVTAEFQSSDVEIDVDDAHDDRQPSHRRTSSQHKPTLSLPLTTNPPSPSNPPSQKVWLIFGATGHMGRSIAKAALAHNDLVCCVGQSYTDTIESMADWYPAAPDRHLGLLCDVRIRSTVQAAIDACKKAFGRLDIIANCSGYGVIGACEDQDEFEVRNQFETNFMGTLNIIQLSLPYFRSRGEGRYLIFSSTSGALGVPGLGPYCATKYAVEGLIESMLYEVDGFGIRGSLVEPGHLRRDDVHVNYQSPKLQYTTTNGGGGGDGKTPAHAKHAAAAPAAAGTQLPLFQHFRIAKPSPPYDTKDAPANHAKRLLQWIGDNQPTSVVKAAELVWQLAHCSYPPLRLLLGTYAVESVRDRLKSVMEEIEDWKYLHFPPMDDHDREKDEDEEDEEGEAGEEGEEPGADGDRLKEEAAEDVEMEGAWIE